MRTIEDIIAEAQSAVAASLREAFDAGRHHQTTEMREKFVAFFEGVIAPFSGAPAAAPAPPAPSPRRRPKRRRLKQWPKPRRRKRLPRPKLRPKRPPSRPPPPDRPRPPALADPRRLSARVTARASHALAPTRRGD